MSIHTTKTHTRNGPELDWGSYFDYYAAWDRDIKNNEQTHPIHIVSFEDVKQVSTRN